MIRLFLATVVWGLLTSLAMAQPAAPLYEECRLDSIFPAGGQRGTNVKVIFQGAQSGLAGPLEIVIDGPPGITARDLKIVNASNNRLEATLEIAADAPLGRRWLRVASERSGLTNFAQFVVGSLPEINETEPNGAAEQGQKVEAPCVVNARIDPAADVDRFRFAGKRGQRFVVAVAAHALDVHGQGRNYGIADLELELFDPQGRTLATADDTLGLDPMIEAVLPADGEYEVRLHLLEFAGYPEAVYRLTLGEVPYVVAAFPPVWNPKSRRPIELFGPNVPVGTKIECADWFDGEPAYRLRHVTVDHERTSGIDVPIVVDERESTIERESDGGARNDEPNAAEPLAIPAAVDGRFDRPGDIDWVSVDLKVGQKIWLETTAQRWLRSPIDTSLQVFDGSGKLVAENDDDTTVEPGYEWLHDFKTTDSRLLFTAQADGIHRVRIAEQSGAGGPRAIYRLSIRDGQPDFALHHFPDSVPIWGPGSSACVLVRVDRWADSQDDVELSIEGLPPGWKGSTNISLGRVKDRFYNYHQNKQFLTITAPADAPVGTRFPFRIVGRSRSADGVVSERASLPLNLYYTSDTGFFRASPRSRVALAKRQGPTLETITTEVEGTPGGTITLQARIRDAGDLKQFPIVVNLATNGVACALNAPAVLPIENGVVTAKMTLPPEMPIGKFGIVVAQTWGSDIRVGMPGPCTELIQLTVKPK